MAANEPSTRIEPTREPGEAQVEDESAWARTTRWSGLLAGGCLASSAILLVLDDLDVLAASPVFHHTSAGSEQDVANWYAAFFARQHRILWALAARDALGAVAMIAVIVLAMALMHRLAVPRSRALPVVSLFAVGSGLTLLSALVSLAQVGYWRNTGWSARPAIPMLVAGRVVEGINTVATYLEIAGDVVLAAALIGLAGLWTNAARGALVLRSAVIAEAVVVAVYALGNLLESDALSGFGSALAGIILGPAVLVALGFAEPRPHVKDRLSRTAAR